MNKELQVAAGTATGTGTPATTLVKNPSAHKALVEHSAQRQLPESKSTAEAVGSTFFALVFVVGVILVLGKLAKRFPAFGLAGARNGMRVVGTLPLGQRDRLVVVEVGAQQLLVGVGEGGPRLLTVLEAPLPEQAPEPANATSFQTHLAQAITQRFGKKTS